MKYFEHLYLLKRIRGLGISGINKQYREIIPRFPYFSDFKEYIVNEGIATKSFVKDISIKTDATIESIYTSGTRSIITSFDDDYPERLRLLGNPMPLYIYIEGDASILNKRTLAIIGTRKPSKYGINACRKIVSEVNDTVIVSGLALGTDMIGHETAINNDLKTIAVLPSGLNIITPSSNKQLAAEIADGRGALVTEYDLDERPEKYTYLRRDAIIAAISDAICVIECGVDSGTMHTVDYAINMKKKIACYYTDRGGDFSGNLKLLTNGNAERIIKPEDVNDILEFDDPKDRIDVYQMSWKDLVSRL